MRWPPKNHGEAFIAHDEASKLQTQKLQDPLAALDQRGPSPRRHLPLNRLSCDANSKSSPLIPHEPNPGGILLCQHAAGTIQRGSSTTLAPNSTMLMSPDATDDGRHCNGYPRFSLIGPQSCMVAFCMSVYRFQCEGERGFWHKHPWHASSSRELTRIGGETDGRAAAHGSSTV